MYYYTHLENLNHLICATILKEYTLATNRQTYSYSSETESQQQMIWQNRLMHWWVNILDGMRSLPDIIKMVMN